MLILPSSSGPPNRLSLDTEKGTPIDNEVALEPDDQKRRVYELLIQQHPQWKLVAASRGRYNCFGLVWATRRTAIYEFPEVRKIIEDDGYRSTSEEATDVGDIVVYWDLKHGPLHAGIVVGRVPLLHGGSTTTLTILSKWNDDGPEVLHRVEDVPKDLQSCERRWYSKR